MKNKKIAFFQNEGKEELIGILKAHKLTPSMPFRTPFQSFFLLMFENFSETSKI
jgi:hypothetical protein